VKILDRQSCYVTVLHDDADSQDELSTSSHFGRFEGLASVRVIKSSNPKGAFIRFNNEQSAVDAIAWCNEQPSKYANASHGFQRYCFKFINGKPCNNKQCENRHSWADTNDVLTGVDYRVGFSHGSEKVPAPAATVLNAKDPKLLKQEISLQDLMIDDLIREIERLRTNNVSLRSNIVQLKSKNEILVQERGVQPPISNYDYVKATSLTVSNLRQHLRSFD